MSQGSPRIIWIRPGGSDLASHVTSFARGPGWITALADGRLSMLRNLIDRDSDEAEVRSFADVVGSVCRAQGASAGQLATTGMTRAAVGEACDTVELPDELRLSARFAGTRRALVRTLRELRHWNLDGDSLMNLSESAEGSLSEKLRGLALIDHAAQRVLKEMGRDQSLDRIRACLDQISDFVPPTSRILVDASATLEPISAEWIMWAARNGMEVTVLLEHSACGGYELSERMAKCFGSGVPGPPKALWCDPLFGSIASDQPAPQVTMMTAPDILAECEWAVRMVQKWHLSGVPSSQIVLFARGAEDYAPLLLSASRRLGVPLQASLRIPLLANGFVAFTLRLLDALASPNLKLLAELSRSTFLKGSDELVNQLDEITLQALKTASDPWEDLKVVDSPLWLDAMIYWRKISSNGPALLKDWLDRLVNLMGELPEMPVDSPTAERDRRAQQALQRALRDVAVTEEARANAISLADFSRLCRELWDEEEMIMPGEGSGTRLVTTTESLPKCSHLVVLGMLEGTLPKRRREDPILSDEDRAAIRRLRLDLPPLLNSHDEALEERSEILRICASADTELVLSYPLTGEDQDNVPAFYLSLFEQLLGDKIVRFAPKRGDLAPPIDECLSPADLEISRAMGAPKDPAPSLWLQTDAARSRVRLGDQGEITPREIRDALTCTFRAAGEHKLRWRPNSQINLWDYVARLPGQIKLNTLPIEAIEGTLLRKLEDSFTGDLFHLQHWERTILRIGLSVATRDWISKETAARKQWVRQPESLRSTSLRELLGDRSFGIEGIKFFVNDRIPMYSETETLGIVSFYRLTTRKLDLDPSNPQSLMDLLYLMPFTHSQRGAIEIDQMNSVRQLLYTGEDQPGVTPEFKQNLRMDRLVGKAEFGAALVAKTKEAATILLHTRMRATPSKECTFCALGELCRSHRDYGEQLGGELG